MDHPGPWPSYAQHYPPRLSSNVNPSQTGQLTDLSSLQRQDPMASYGLLPAHHVSQGVPHNDANFVNSGNMLSAPCDPMMSTFHPSGKGHQAIGGLGLPHGHNAALFKNLSKETEINELRGGFSRQAGLPPGAMVTGDPNLGISSGTPMTSANLFNPQSSPHSWRSTDMMPTPSSPFGVLPHETVSHRSNVESGLVGVSSTAKSHPQASVKASRSLADSGRYAEAELSYRNVLLDPSNGVAPPSRAPMMMHGPPAPNQQQADSIPTTAPSDSMNLAVMKPEYMGYHGNPAAGLIGNQQRSLLEQNYLPHAQYATMDMHGGPAQKPGDMYTTMKVSETSDASSGSEMYVGTMGVTTSNSVSSPAPSRIQHAPGPSVVNVTGNLVTGPPSMASPIDQSPPTSSQSQSHEMSSSYATYNTTPTIPTHSQSFLANQMPSAPPSMSEMEYSGPQQVGVIATQGNAGPPPGHHMSDMPNVAYSSVITRTSAVTPHMSPNSFPPDVMMMANPQAGGRQIKLTAKGKRRGRPPKNPMYAPELKTPVTGDTCLMNMGMASGKNEMLGNMLVDPAENLDALVMNGSGSHSDSSRQALNIDAMFNGQDMTLDELANVTGDGRNLLPHAANDPVMSLPLMNDDANEPQKGKKRRRRKRKGGIDDDEDVVSQAPQAMSIGPMTPVSAGKLSHKVAAPHLSQTPSASPLSPMDLSSGDGTPSLSHLPDNEVENVSASGVNGGSAAAEAAAKARQSIEDEFCASGLNCIIETNTVERDLDSDDEADADDDDDDEDDNSGNDDDLDASLSSSLPDESETTPERTRSVIEEELSFLAELPPECNIKSQPRSRVPINTSCPSVNEAYLKTFLQFVKGEVPPPLASLGPQRRPRGRGGRGGMSRSERAYSRADESAKSELNPSTGLFIPRDTPTPPGSVEPIMDVFADLVSPPGSPSRGKDENNHGSEDRESSVPNRRPANHPSVVYMSSPSGAESLKIKLVGLQSGKIQKAKRGGWSGRGQNVARRARGKTRRTSYDSPPTPEDEYNYEPAGGSEDIKEEEPPPRRLSMRKCKAKTMQKRQERIQRRSTPSNISIGDYSVDSDADDFLSNASSESEKELPRYDSDSDPAWTADREESEKEASPDDDDDDYEPFSTRTLGGRGRRRVRAGSRGKRPRLGGSGSDSQQSGTARRGRPVGYTRADEDLIDVNEGAGKVGDFVISLADLAKPGPTPIWRIDSKRLLQKFEPNDENGRLLYHARSMYSGWTANTRLNYQAIKVRIVSSNLRNMIVEYNKEESIVEPPPPTPPPPPVVVMEEEEPAPTAEAEAAVAEDGAEESVEEGVEKGVEEGVEEGENNEDEEETPAEKTPDNPKEAEDEEDENEYSELVLRKENFEVYIQTLISRSLDPTFISEIIKEKDEYFLSHVQEIDAVVERCKNHMVTEMTWDDELKECIERYPCVTTSFPKKNEDEQPCCEVCSTLPGIKSVQFKGQRYDYTTLMYESDDGNEDKDQEEEMSRRFLMCNKCFKSTSLYSRIHHQKFNFYIHCDSKVKNIRESDPSRESHIILELCLKDSVWMNKLFEDVLAMWRQCLRLPR